MLTIENGKRCVFPALLAILAMPLACAAQAEQRPVVTVQTDNREESQTLIELLVSSNIIDRDGIATRPEAVNDINVLKRLVTTGEAGDYAATFLALRQVPFVGSAGEDNIKEMSARMLQTSLATTDPAIRTITLCPQTGNCNAVPLTQSELTVAVGGGREGAPALPSMQPNRGLPINRPVAAMTGFLDSQMNTTRFLPRKANGERMTVAEAVADLQTRHPATVTNETLASCLANENTYSIAQCALAGVRAGLAFNNESGVRYDIGRAL